MMEWAGSEKRRVHGDSDMLLMFIWYARDLYNLTTHESIYNVYIGYLIYLYAASN